MKRILLSTVFILAACSGRQRTQPPMPELHAEAGAPEPDTQPTPLQEPATDLERGLRAMLAGQMSAALGWFEMASVTAPDDPELGINIAITRLALGDRELALREALAAEERRPGDPRIAFDRAAIQARLGLYEPAIETLTALVDHPRLGATAQDHLAAALLASARLTEAAQVLADSAAERPNDPAVQNHLGILAEANGDRDAAIEHYGRALDAAPDALAPRRNRAMLLIAMDRRRPAQRDLEHYLLHAPFNTLDRGAMQGRLDRLRDR